MNQNGQDKKRQELREQYEDACIQMLLYEVAKMEGEELLEKNERLKNDPNFQVPESITEKCLETIRREVAKQEKQKRMACIRRAAIRVACVAAILAAMAITAYAAFPAVRAATRNLLIQTSKVSTRLVLGDKNESGREQDNNTDESNAVKTVFGYVIPEMPVGFQLESERIEDVVAWLRYTDGKGDIIKLSFSKDLKNAIEVDTEGIDVCEIKIHGNDGLLCVKEKTVSIVWIDKQANCFVMVQGIGVERETILRIAEGFAEKMEK